MKTINGYSHQFAFTERLPIDNKGGEIICPEIICLP
jgi:hypothetical protein